MVATSIGAPPKYICLIFISSRSLPTSVDSTTCLGGANSEKDVQLSGNLTCYNPMETTNHGLSPVVKLAFLSTCPPPSVISRLQELALVEFRRMVGKGEVVFRRLCLSKTGEGVEVFREGRC